MTLYEVDSDGFARNPKSGH